MTEELTTIQIDVKTREMLRQVASVNERSMTAQLRWMVTQEYTKCFPDSDCSETTDQEVERRR